MNDLDLSELLQGRDPDLFRSRPPQRHRAGLSTAIGLAVVTGLVRCLARKVAD